VKAPIVLIEDIVNDWEGRDVPWAVHGLAYYGGTTLVSAPPKIGKSTFLADLARARTNNEAEWIGRALRGDGPTLLLTEEGAFPTAFRWHRSTELAVMLWHEAIRAHNATMEGVYPRGGPGTTREQVEQQRAFWSFRSWTLREVREWLDGQRQAMVIVDTLARWAGIADENDASEVTKVIGEYMQVAQDTGSSVILVHHARKGGGKDGEAIRGSGAVLGTVDVAAELFRKAEGSDQRRLDLRGRVIFDESTVLDYDRDTGVYSVGVDTSAPVAETWVNAVPDDGTGMSIDALVVAWGNIPKSTAQNRAASLVKNDRLRRETVATGKGAPAYRYWRNGHAGSPRPVGGTFRDVFEDQSD
jgi:hypothetical protein